MVHSYRWPIRTWRRAFIVFAVLEGMLVIIGVSIGTSPSFYTALPIAVGVCP